MGIISFLLVYLSAASLVTMSHMFALELSKIYLRKTVNFLVVVEQKYFQTFTCSKIAAIQQIFPSLLMPITAVFISDCLPNIHFISLP